MATIFRGSLYKFIIDVYKYQGFFCTELRENLTRVGANLKQGFIEAVRSTWATINQFARSHRTEAQLGEEEDENETAVIKPLQSYEEEGQEVIENEEGSKIIFFIPVFIFSFVASFYQSDENPRISADA